jgi:hypothetical protein
MGDRPQAIINKQILAGCDLLVAVFWTRLGSPTGAAASGTVEEIQEHLASGKPTMLYFSTAPVRPDSVDEAQYVALKGFRQECYGRGLVESYDSIGEFRDKFSRQLSQTVIRDYGGAVHVATARDDPPRELPAVPRLSPEAKGLLIEAAADRNGNVLRIRHLGGLAVQTNGKVFTVGGDARSEARWESVIRELEELGLIESGGSKREVFSVSDDGYRVADLMRGT